MQRFLTIFLPLCCLCLGGTLLHAQDQAAPPALSATNEAPVVSPWIPRDPEEEVYLRMDFKPELGGQIPLDIELRDEKFQKVKLGSYFDGRPVILAIVYFECPSICSAALNGLVDALNELKYKAGEDFRILTVSFNHKETHVLAKNKKVNYLKMLNTPVAEEDWHFLVGEQSEVEKLCRACNFNYKMNPETQQYAHASGLLILTPTGVMSRFLPGIQFPVRDVELSLVDASEGKVGTWIDRLTLLCYAYDPETGKYGALIQQTVMLACVGTVGFLGLTLTLLMRKDLKKHRLPEEPPTDQA